MNHIGDIAQMIIALAAAFSAYQSWLSKRQSKINAIEIEKVHKATNSLTDRLVASTAKENFEAGVKHGEDNPRET